MSIGTKTTIGRKYTQFTIDDIKEITRSIDSLLICANSEPELLRKLNVLRKNGSHDWSLLRTPSWVKDKLVAVVIKPAKE